MRELKFRAWVNEHWVDWLPTCKTLGAYNANIIDTDGYTFEEDNPFIVEQYTGLKDKNGKEIYEGDIVTETYPLKYTNPESPDNIEAIDYWIVKWEEKRAGFAPFCNCDTNGEYLYEVHVPDIVEVEVVGNIHENSEILEEDK